MTTSDTRPLSVHAPQAMADGGEGPPPALPLPKVSIIIATYNRLREVRANLGFLAKLRYPNTEIIVVDDGSTDGTAEAMAGFPQVRFVRLETNGGPAAARNVAIQAATGKYALFLDSDGILSRRGLSDAVGRMEREPDIAVLGGRIVNFYSRKLDQWVYGPSPSTHYRLTFDTYSFSAAGALVRLDAARQVGGFWGDLFIYNEEVDLSLRLLQCGWRVVYCPALCVYHCTSPDRRAAGPGYWHLQMRNRLWIVWRYYPLPQCLTKFAVYVALAMLKGLRNDRLGACMGGVWAGLRGWRQCRRLGPRLTRTQLHRVESLNPRHRVMWGQ